MKRFIDLTLAQYEGNPTHPVHGRTPRMLPGTGSHALTAQRRIPNPYDGTPVSAQNEYIVITGHTGTHVDAPSHVDHLSPITAEHLPLERTQGTAMWLDLSRRSPHGPIEPDDLARAEEDAGETVRPGDIVLLHTARHEHQDTTARDTERLKQAPYLTRQSAEYLRSRAIGALGVDTPSPEAHDALDLPVHMNFLRPRSLGLPPSDYILIYENLCNIALIGAPRFHFVGVPIPFRDSTGSPVRAYAVVE